MHDLHDGDAPYRFGVFEFDARALELRKNGRRVRVRPQSLKLLALLLERPGDVISREEIQANVWGTETFVDFEQGVNHCIRDLRSALGDTAESPRFVQTLPRRGYRFVAPVETTAAAIGQVGAAPAPAPERGTRLSWWILAAIGLTAAVAGLVVWSYDAAPRSPSSPGASRLIVMPFSTAGGDPVLGTGLATAIAARLAGQTSLIVQSKSRTVASTDHGPGGTLVMAGDVGTNGSQVTVDVRLEDSSNGSRVWSNRFTVRADQFFSVEDVIAGRVVDALNLRLAAADQERLRRRYTSNTAAYEDYLRGLAAIVRYTPDGTRQAIGAFESALKRDPGYALARAGLAMACADMYLRFAPAAEIEQWGARAEAEARAALDTDPNLAEAHLARAAVARKREFDWDATVASSRRALVLNPSLDHAHFFIAAAYYHLGYMDEALMALAQGREVRGVDVVEPVRIEALVALFSGNFGKARVHLEEVSRLSSSPLGDTYLALAYYYSGNVARGEAMLTSLATNPSASTATRAGAALAGVLAARGDASNARRFIAAALAREYRDHHVAYSLGVAYAQLREYEPAVRWLRTAADTGFPCTTWVERDPLLEPLRRTTEFRALRVYIQARRDAALTRSDR